MIDSITDRRRARRLLMLVVFLTTGRLPAQQAQASRETITGIVRGADTSLIANAQITVTPAGAGATQSVPARSNAEGRWSVSMPVKSSEYFVTVSAIGWVQARVTVKSSPTNAPVVVDVTLKKSSVTLATVRVTEQRRLPPPRESFIPLDVAQVEKGVLASSEVFAASDAGNLVGMVAQVPGVSLLPDPSGGPPSFSVLGLSSAQNNVTLNGLNFGGGEIPRDVQGAVRVTTSSYDVARGGFSGAQLSVTHFPAGNFHSRFAHVTYDAPTLQATDRVGRQLGQQYTNMIVSGAADGPIVFDKVFYNVSAQAGKRESDLRSLLTGDALSLERLGVARDSVSAFLAAAQTRGIPLSPGSVPTQRETTSGSVLARLDWTPSQTAIGNVLASLRTNKTRASFVGPTAVPAHGGDVTRSGGDLAGQFSVLIHKSILNDTRVGVHSDETNATPYLALPDARVFVTSQFSDNTAGLSSFVFGGNSSLPRRSRTSGAELLNQTTWNSLNAAHRIRITADARIDALSVSTSGNTLGSYTYNSIADFQANRAATFTRTLVSNEIAPSMQTGAIAIGDQWHALDRLNLVYGVRLDANRATTAPPYNGAVDSAFHLRTNYSPREAHLSPRVGFNWSFGNNGTTGIPGFGAPWGSLTGGVGEFRNDMRPGLIAPTLSNTGLINGLQQITCIGGAVPTPDFSAFMNNPASIPGACADGVVSAYANTRPNVTLVTPGFQSQRSWRGNLTLRGPLVTKLVRFSADAVYSLNLHQQSLVDVNFAPIKRGSVALESNRPVYVLPSSIVPATGAMTFLDSRASTRFGSVNAINSDLKSDSKQFTFSVNPIGLSTNSLRWSVSYVLSQLRDQQRGFGSTTAGDPLTVEWGRSALDTRHAVNFNVYFRVRDWFSVAATGRASSGAPFTPVVDGDINGDGLWNDRAFVFSPASGDSTLRAGMSGLLANASPRVRNCLTRQAGAIAARGSCEGPWTGTMAAQIRLNPQKIGWSNRASLSLNLANPLAGIDELLHGSAHMQGWGQPAFADPTLLRVRGYDPTSGSYRYEVNQRFGDTRLARSGVRVPFVMTLEARVQLGQDFEEQRIEQLMAPGRTRAGDKLTIQQLRARLVNSVFNPIRGILDVKDSLSVLSQAQIERMTVVQRRLLAKQDTIWAPISEYLSSLPAQYDNVEALRRMRAGQVATFDAMFEAMTELSKIFTPEQIADFPPALRSFFDLQQLKTNRPVPGFFPGY